MYLPSWIVLNDLAQGEVTPAPPSQTPPPTNAPEGTAEKSTTSADGSANKGASQGGEIYSTIIMFGGMFVLLWFFLLGPERRKRKAHELQLSQIKEKDEVMTLGGIFGTVVMLRGEQLTIRVDEKRGTTLRIARSSVATILPRGTVGKDQDEASEAS